MKVTSLVINAQNCRGCRSCQLACSFTRYQVFNPARSVIVIERDIETEHTAPMISPIECDLCGGDPACQRACPYKAIEAGQPDLGYKLLYRS